MQHHNCLFRQFAIYAITSEEIADPVAILYAIDCSTCQLIRTPSSANVVAQDWARLECKNDGEVNNAGGGCSRKDSNEWPEWATVKGDFEFEQRKRIRQQRGEQRVNQDADYADDSSDESNNASEFAGGESAHSDAFRKSSSCGNE